MVDNFDYNNFNTPNSNLLSPEYTYNQNLNNDISKLMYDLYTTNMLIKVNIENKYLNYQNFKNLTEKDEKAIYNLALKYQANVLIDNQILILDSNLLERNSFNTFYNINDERIGKKINDKIFIGGCTVYVLQVMACNYEWISKYYHEPMEKVKNEKVPTFNFEIINDNSNTNYSNNIDNENINNRNNNDDCGIPLCCQYCICCIFIIFVIAISILSGGSVTIQFN